MRIHHARNTIPEGGEDEARAFYGGLLGLSLADIRTRATFTVPNLDALRARLEQADFEVQDAPPVEGRRRFHAWDPFGNRLEFVDRNPSTP